MTKLSLRRRMSGKNQVAIPVVLLKRYHFKPEADVLFEAVEDGILINQADDPIEKSRGLLKGMGISSTELKRKIRKEELEFEQRKFNH